MTLPALTEEECNFSVDRVPDRELVPCLIREFLRESVTARQLHHDIVTMDTGPMRWRDFAADEGGDAIDFLAKARGLSIGDAIRELKRLSEI